MESKTFRGFLYFFYVVACVVFNQQSSAGTWADAFEDNNTQEWEVFNTFDEEETKWWIDRGEAVCETFEPNILSIWATGEPSWKNYSLSCKTKLVKAKGEPATFGIIVHQQWEKLSFYEFLIFYPWEIVHITKVSREGADTLGEFDFTVKLDTWYTLTASIDSRGKIKFQIDNEVFTAVDTNPIKKGKAGLVASGAQVRFDDVEITGTNIPDGGPGALPIEPRGKLAITWGKLKKR